MGLRTCEIQVGWTQPNSDWYKLNMDGAVKTHSERAGCGGVLRDCCGKWIVGFGDNLGIASVNEAKLWGLYNGLQMAWNTSFRRIEVELDSQVVLQLLEKDVSLLHPLGALVSCCKQFITHDWAVKLHHTYREGNRIADHLANWSLQ